jgi:anaerobic magnesium-protoporphyrin IX monomethyl ester cyclase
MGTFIMAEKKSLSQPHLTTSNGTIGIIAPIHSSRVEKDFILRFKSGKELTIRNIAELIRNGYDVSKLPVSDAFSTEDASAAGYFLSSYLRRNNYDTVLSAMTDDKSLSKMADASPFAICLSTSLIARRSDCMDVTRRIREYMPDVPIIAGGMLVWKSYLLLQNPLYPQLARTEKAMKELYIFPGSPEELNVDIFVVSPHGTSILLEILKRLKLVRKGDFSDIPNLALPFDDSYRFTSRTDEHIDYNNEFTRWDLIDELPSRIPLRTSIGCPFRCEYCDFCQLSPKIFVRSRESLLEELGSMKAAFKRLHSLITMIALSDDNIFLNDQRLREICTMFIDSKINKYWGGFIRADRVNQTNIDLIKASGFYMGMAGVESGDPEQLCRMNKEVDLSKVKNGLELLDGMGIPVLMTFLVGFPGETEKSLERTAGFLNSLCQTKGFLNYQLYSLLIFPLSRLSSQSSRQRWNLSGVGSEWSHLSMKSSDTPAAMSRIFEAVTAVSYTYYYESFMYLRKFDVHAIKKMVGLRQRMTVDLIKGRTWPDIASTFVKFADVFQVPASPPSAALREQIAVPGMESA